MTRIALTIAGSDSGGGAGIQADLKTFSALGVYGATAITAITAQNTRAVTAVEELSPDIVGAQIDAVMEDLDVRAIKIGMLFSAPIIRTVAERLTGAVPVVVDPVMVAKSGDMLLRPEAVAAMLDAMLPRALLLTPNLPEAGRLLGEEPARGVDEMVRQGEALMACGAGAVLMKGGHANGASCTDVLVTRGAEPVILSAERLTTRNTHGTGCTLSAAIAAGLAKGLGLEAAVRGAHGYLNAAIKAADRLSVGRGHGPVHHFHGGVAW